MASKSAQKQQSSVEEAEEMLDELDKALERLKSMYEQYFLGIQKQAPGPLHSEVERKIRELLQTQLRNTAHRYRFVTLQQKFSSYNAYWRRTVRQIEQGTYFRNLSKIGRNAARTGEEIPEEILAAMPKRMREQVIRDREVAIAQARRRGKLAGAGEPATGPAGAELLELGADDFASEGQTAGDSTFANEEPPMELGEDAFADAIAMINESTELKRQVKNQRKLQHAVTEDDGELDINAFFASVEAQDDAPKSPSAPEVRRSVTRATVAPDGGLPAATPPAERFLPTTTSPGIQPMARTQAQAFPTHGKRPTGPLAVPRPPTSVPSNIPPRATQPGIAPAASPAPPARPSQPMAAQPTPPPQRVSQPMAAQRPSQPMAAQPTPPPQRISQPMAAQRPSQPMAAQPTPPPQRISQPIPVQVTQSVPMPARSTQAIPRRPEDMRTPPPERVGPPPGMTEGDVNALYAKYVKAKEMVGENAGPGAYGKLLKTINAQAPKIMEQYKAKGVDFQVVVKDNQVIIRAKPKT
nr:MXAN_5187 C-terminal domain-containing protein [Kofleriaceae bacterium]